MTYDQQAALVAEAKGGSVCAVEELLRYLERDIRGMVSKLARSASDRQDLAQVARAAALKALAKYDPSKDKQFRFYAAQWARTEARRHATTFPSVVTRNVRTRPAGDVSLVSSSEDGVDVYLDVPDESPSPEDAYSTMEQAHALRLALEEAVQRTVGAHRAVCRSVVYERLLAHDPLALGVIARQHGVGREVVRQVERDVMEAVADALDD